MNDAPRETSIDPLRPQADSRRPRERHPLLRAVMFASGCLLLLAGFVLGFVPLMPGFPLGLLGIGLLAASSSRVRVLLRNAVGRLPFKWQRRLHAFTKDARKQSDR